MPKRASIGLKAAALASLALCAVLPASAMANSAAVDYFRNRASRTAVPSLLTAEERSFYTDLFAAIDRKDWPQVQALLARKPDGPLHQVAKAEYYLAAGSPRIDLPELSGWLTKSADLPQAEQIAGLAERRGADSLPPLPQQQTLISLPTRAKRIRPARNAGWLHARQRIGGDQHPDQE